MRLSSLTRVEYMSFSSSVVCSASSRIDRYSIVIVPVGTVGEVMTMVYVDGFVPARASLFVAGAAA